MKTLTREQALAELAALPGYSAQVASNVLFEATKRPYCVVNNGALFIAVTDSGQFLLADLARDRSGHFPDGAAFAATLNEAQAAGARFPGWVSA